MNNLSLLMQQYMFSHLLYIYTEGIYQCPKSHAIPYQIYKSTIGVFTWPPAFLSR